ncbi:TolB family protein [Acidobacteriota bacterium]
MKMIKIHGYLLLIIGLIFSGSGCKGTEAVLHEVPSVTGEYFGQTPPGMKGELFAPGIISTEMPELNAVFFPGGKEVIYSVTVGPMRWALVMMREEGGRWTPPEIAPFSGPNGGVDPFVSYDGNTVYFCSNRPHSGNGEPEKDFDIWYVTRTDSGWSDPLNMGAPVNSPEHEFYPCLSRDGTFYVQSRREGGLGGADIYRFPLIEGGYPEAESLPEPINSPAFEGDTLIAPDGSYIIVSTFRKEDNIGQSDLYISFLLDDGSWSPLKNMGPEVNSTGGENCQILSPCGKYLFYTSRRHFWQSGPNPESYEAIRSLWGNPQNGVGDVYWVDARIIETLRPNQ